LCGKTDLPDLYEVMKNSNCVIANDSGAVHVAGVSCKKVISLHGPTPFSETGPYGNSRNQIIEANIKLKCSPCYNTDEIRKCKQNRCMIDLSPEAVFKYI
jgi:ADP-heptose:LPS heptosyltransferase